ncbi:MAG: ABC transporter permease subunit [Paracoccaceae bacterium]
MDFAFIIEALPRLLPGLWLTVQLSVHRESRSPARQRSAWHAFVSRDFIIIDTYVFIVRGTPILVQVYAAYFLLPMAGLKLGPFWTGIVALVFNSAGYQIEIARASMRSIEVGRGCELQRFVFRHPGCPERGDRRLSDP